MDTARCSVTSAPDVEAGLAADVWTIGYSNKPGKDEALRDAGADGPAGWPPPGAAECSTLSVRVGA